MVKIPLANEAATRALGARLARACPPGVVVYLCGALGAGKTTLVRGFLGGLGYQGAVRSPTYTLLETYPIGAALFAHLDLYRIADPEELEFLGLRDLAAQRASLLVEWPERGSGILPPADVVVNMEYVRSGRDAKLMAATLAGDRLVAVLRSFNAHDSERPGIDAGV
jgi:tRNA threonylcarbamoyladenosine biosynthesis protein TsaE